MDKRKFLLWAGKQLIDTKLGGILSISVGILGLVLHLVSRDALENYFGFATAGELQWYIAKITILMIIVYGGFQFLGHTLIRWGKSVRSNVQIISLDPPDTENIWVEKQLTKHYFASLKIINNEETELTECYAVLKSGRPASLSTDHYNWLGQGTKKIKWKNTKECLVNIGPWNGEDILHIYVVSYHLEKHDVLLSKFCICGDDSITLSPSVRYKFTMELNGKLNGESIKPIPFHGSFDVSIKKTADSFEISGMVIQEDKLS